MLLFPSIPLNELVHNEFIWSFNRFLPSDSNNVNNGNNTSNGGTNKGNNNPTMATELLDISTAEILDDSTMSGLIGLQNSMLKHSQASLSSEQDFLPFAKDICGRYIVLYTFIARDENDVSVERGEFVTGAFNSFAVRAIVFLINSIFI